MENFKYTKGVVDRYRLKEKSWWADITLSEDGFVNIQSDYGDYHYRWNDFGPCIKKFLIACDKGYLYSKFGMNLPGEFNFKETIKLIRKDIKEQRKDKVFSAEDCREYWDITEALKKEHYFSVNDWGHAVENSGLDRLYAGDLSSMPCVMDDNYPLTTFLTLIWPGFINILKEETKE
jgi:hypothetical protein